MGGQVEGQVEVLRTYERLWLVGDGCTIETVPQSCFHRIRTPTQSRLLVPWRIL